MSPDRVGTDVDGRRLALSNLDKVLFSQTGFTKGEMIDNYARISTMILPSLEERLVTMRRFPDGVDGASFLNEQAPARRPDWVETVTLPFGQPRSGAIEYAVVRDRPTIAWTANLASIELHVPHWKIPAASQCAHSPDFLVLDLDPGPGDDGRGLLHRRAVDRRTARVRPDHRQDQRIEGAPALPPGAGCHIEPDDE